MISASRLTYSSSSTSPMSSASWRFIRSSLIGVSSVSCSSTVRWTLSSVHSVPDHGPVNGARRIEESRPIGRLVRLLQLELDVDEAVRRPRTGVLEREDVLVLAADLADHVVELLFPPAIHEKRRVRDHPVADNLVAAARHRDGFQRLVYVGDVAVAGLLHRALDQAAELHPREVRGRRRVPRDLVLEPANLVVLLLDLRDDLLPVPQNLEPELDLVLHLVEHVRERAVRRPKQLGHVLFRAEDRPEGHRNYRELPHDGFVHELVRQHVLARRIVD